MSKAREIADLGDVVTVDGSNVGIGTSSPAYLIDARTTSGNAQIGVTSGGDLAQLILTSTDTAGSSQINFADADSSNVGMLQYFHSDNHMEFTVNGSEAMRIDSSGNLLVGKTADDITIVGTQLRPDGAVMGTRSGGQPLTLNRTSSDGDIAQFRKDGTSVGSIGANSGKLYISNDTGTGGLRFYNGGVNPCDASGNDSDNQRDLGKLTSRWDDIYATNATIQTSDRNEKQQIAELTAAEMDAAKAISKLFKTFKWNDAVAEKGDAARTHTGVIAQEVEAAMTAAGLNAGDYAFFISSTWWESTEVIPAVDEVLDEEGNVVTEAQPERTVTHTHDTQEEAPEGAVEKTRKGIRYPELLSFIGAATEQRLASIEARLDALEA